MKSAIIIGGTGLVGKKISRLLLADKRYSLVKMLVRKPIDIIYEKLELITFKFDEPDSSVLMADEVFCCLGTTIKDAGSKKAFYKVDFEYSVTLAKMAYNNGCRKFAIVSSMGANKNSTLFYNKTKGQAEAAIKEIGFESCFIFRPSLLLGNRNTPRLGESIAKFFMTNISFLLPVKYRPIHSNLVAQAMQYAMNSNLTGFHIFESDKIAALAALPSGAI